jgi:hypothetical protein
MRTTKSVIALVFAFAVAGWMLWRPAAVLPQAAPSGEDMAQFRLTVGVTDKTAKDWEGAVSVTGGELDSAQGFRFSQQDRIAADGKFRFRTKVGNLENQLRNAGHPYGATDWGSPETQRLIPQGLILRARGADSMRIKFESGSDAFEFAASAVPMGKPLAVLGGNGLVERLPVEYRLSEAGPADDYPAIAVAPNGGRWVAWLSYREKADVVMASGPGQVHTLTKRGDHHSPTVVHDGKDTLWAVWSRNDAGTWNLYARSFNGRDWTEEEKLTNAAGSNLWPRLASDGNGAVAVVWQGFRNNQAVILAMRREAGKWMPEQTISQGPGNCWAPSAAFRAGKLWVAWDSYATGAYQVYAREGAGPVERITKGANFSVRPSIAVVAGKPVVAWEESDALWGKDFTFLCDRRGTVIYKNRRLRAAFRDGTGWKEIASPMDAVPPAIRRFVQQPQLAADETGRLFLLFRCRTTVGTSRIDYWAAQGRWETFVTHLEGDRWSAAVPMPSSVARNGATSSIAARGGRAFAAWSTDGRAWPNVRYQELDVVTTALDDPASAATLAGGKPIVAEPAPAANAHPNEAADTRQTRAYRVKLNGKEYRILRGDLHRHTELSGDGAGDGSLDDLYRYTLDAAAMDYTHVGDHQMGNDEEYNWWITQKSNDLYFMGGRFVPLYGYERSVWYPNGHRNVVWAERGKPVLKISPAEAKGEISSGPILYPYLRETNGIGTSHSSATEQGTDWRDNDPKLEPFVEIYQGFESNYEHPGAPRAWKESEAKVHQGERKDGYVWNAWAKGFKLGVQSSSDHISTHSSYACILVEDFSRQGLLDAMRKRHSYGATDQIVLDYRITTLDAGTFMMGDVFSTSSRPKLLVKALGTAAVKQVDVIRNNQYIYKVNPGRKDVSFEYVDNAPPKGESYYYVRVEQTDGQLAWSSPIWVTAKTAPMGR